MRVAVTHMRDVVIHVQVALAVHVKEPDILASNNVQRLVIKQRGVLAQYLVTSL